MANNKVHRVVIHSTLSNVPVLDVVHIAASDQGLITIAFNNSLDVFVTQLTKTHKHILSAPQKELSTAGQQLQEYLSGSRRQFSLPLDLTDLTIFQISVLEAVAQVPYGQTSSYARIASSIGNPKSARAVGQVNASNPLPIIFPCHRIINSNGSLGGYSSPGGLQTKRSLLDLEGVYTEGRSNRLPTPEGFL